MGRQNKGVAWYDIKGSGWFRDIFVLLHPPYTLWHLSYVPVGAALAPSLNWAVMGWTLLAFFLGMGIGGHFLDELNGRPLRTMLPEWILGWGALVSIALAIGIGAGVAAWTHNYWIIPLMVIGGFIVVAYNMEWPTKKMRLYTWHILPEGFFHQDEFFGLAWGAFPAVTAYVAQTGSLSWALVILAVYAYLSSMAQRKLSLQARFWRRKVSGLSGEYVKYGDAIEAPTHQLNRDDIIGPVDLGLKYFNGAVVAVAVGLLVYRLVG